MVLKNKIGLILNSLMRIMYCVKYNLFREFYLRRDIMKKFALTTLAVMAAVGVLAVQPADAKKVQQDSVVSPIEMPMNDEIQQVNGVSKATNKETQRLSNKLADATKAMVKKNWKTIYVKAVPTGDKAAVRFYYVDTRGQVHNGQVIRNTGLSKGKYMTGSLRQAEALQELINHLERTGQEVPSSIDIIITQGGYRSKMIFNYDEDTSNLPAYQQQYEQQNFPTMK